MTNKFKIISEDGLKTLCKAIKKVSTIGEIIDDVNSVTDKTYSSFEIDGRLNTKIDKTQLTTVLDENVTDEQIPGAKVVVDELNTKANDSEVVKKTDIATTINSTSTDREVASAKAVYNTTREFLKTYTSIEQLGLTSGSETIENIVNSMESRTRLITIIELPNKYIYPGNCGTLIVEKLNIYRVHFKFCADGVSTVFVGTYHAVSGFTGWQRLCTTTVADVGVTAVTSFSSNYSSGSITYMVKNGICYVFVHDLRLTHAGSEINICANMPKPALGFVDVLAESGGIVVGNIMIKSNGELTSHYVNSSAPIYTTFSYPVAE